MVGEEHCGVEAGEGIGVSSRGGGEAFGIPGAEGETAVVGGDGAVLPGEFPESGGAGGESLVEQSPGGAVGSAVSQGVGDSIL